MQPAYGHAIAAGRHAIVFYRCLLIFILEVDRSAVLRLQLIYALLRLRENA